MQKKPPNGVCEGVFTTTQARQRYLAASHSGAPNLQMLMPLTFKWLMLTEMLKLNTVMRFVFFLLSE